MKPLLPLLVSLVIINCLLNFKPVEGQRSLLHWKRDLEFRLGSYQDRRATIDNILASSIEKVEQRIENSIARVVSGSNIRFSHLIVQNGSIILNSNIAKWTADNLVAKTRTYVSSKENELSQMRAQLIAIGQQLDDLNQDYIYKGSPSSNYDASRQNMFRSVAGTRLFKQFNYARLIDSNQAVLKQVNYTDVDYVLKETYMENPNVGILDSKSRLFFEGKKTFYNTAFKGQLRSGCCDRLKPLHTSRMMRRSINQNVQAPVLFQIQTPPYISAVLIKNIQTPQLVNQALSVSNYGSMNLSPPDNIIQLENLIDLRSPVQLEVEKALIFKGPINIVHAHLSLVGPESRLAIGYVSNPNLFLDLNLDNYLLRLRKERNQTVQRVSGPVVVNAPTQFLKGLNAFSVNNIPNFNQFAIGSIIRVDKPAVIQGPVQFYAMPRMLNTIGGVNQQMAQTVLTMRVSGSLQVNLVNGLRLPEDIVVFPPSPGAINQNQLIRVFGPRQFSGRVVFEEPVQVRQFVNNLLIPGGVIPLHSSDLLGSVGITNLIFKDGIIARDINVDSGQFDEISLRDVIGDAPSLIFNSVFLLQPDGSHLIRAPIKVANLRMLGNGLLNGFRPQDVIELSRQPPDLIYGRKSFLAHVEAAECIFNDINNLANWTNHLIRIDRPNTVQTVFTKLAFLQGVTPSSVGINRLRADFYPNKSPSDYMSNMRFSPELYVLNQALLQGLGANNTRGRIRITDRVSIVNPRGGPGIINGVRLDDVLTVNEPFKFAGRFTMVGKVQVGGNLQADRIRSNYPIDAMDLEQFDKVRIPIINSRLPVRLNNLVLDNDNQASFVQCRILNGIPFSQFANSIMSLTRPQVIEGRMSFGSSVDFEGLLRTGSSLNGIKEFKKFANSLKNAKYSFEDGLQCNTLVINN